MPLTPINAVFAARLKAAREAIGISQSELGRKIGLPAEVALNRVNRYERARHAPDIATAEQLADALGIPLPALLARDDAMALLITGFGRLPKDKQQAVLKRVMQDLGAAEAEEARAQLEARTAPAKTPDGKLRRP